MQDHFFVDSATGSLFDTRVKDWSKVAPLRRCWSHHYSKIGCVMHLKASLRAGNYAWPGGYPLYFACNDGSLLHCDCVRKHIGEHIREIQDKDANRIISCDVNWEDTTMECEHCGDKIESAYGDDE